MHHTQLYREWGYMKNRCYNPNSDSYKYYGARGIIICDEWKDDFMAFYNWAGYQLTNKQGTRDEHILLNIMERKCLLLKLANFLI